MQTNVEGKKPKCLLRSREREREMYWKKERCTINNMLYWLFR
jgi:hypothetical protein